MSGASIAGGAAALAGGALLGLLFFGGLYLTVRRIPRAKNPAALTAGSFLGRTLLSGAGFLLIALAGGFYLVVSLVGFIAVQVAFAAAKRPGREEERPGEERA